MAYTPVTVRWQDFSTWQKVLIVVVGVWWVFGAFAASAVGFRDPWFVVGLPFIGVFVFMALLWLLEHLLRWLGR